MKVALVFPPFYLESLYNLPPLGLVYLATGLRSQGHEVTILDFVLALRQGELSFDSKIYDQCAERVLESGPDVVGFSAQCTTYPGIVQIARKIKDKREELRIVLGGHNASFLDEATLKTFPCIDAVIRGEGEISFPGLIDSYQQGGQGEGVHGVTWRDNGNIVRNPERELLQDLNNLPFPEYDFLPPLTTYRDACGLPRSIAVLEVGRGCPHNCIYCSQSRMWRRKQRVYSVERIVREMTLLRDVHQAECFVLAYDQFTSRKSFVRQFCQQVLDNGLETTPWYCISRLDTVDEEELELMRKAGCESMCYGIDSGSRKTLAFIHKNIERDILYQKVRQTTDLGMVPTLSFIIGFPEEGLEDIDQTLSLALKTGIQGKSLPLFQMPTVLPGTELHQRYLNELRREVDTYFALGLEFDQGKRLETDEQMIDSYPELFSCFYNLPCPSLSLKELAAITETFPLMVLNYPMTFFLLARALDRSPTHLFMDWLKWAQLKDDCNDLVTAGKKSLPLFPDFVIIHLNRYLADSFSHLGDILSYEQAFLAVGQKPRTDADRQSITDQGISHLFPVKYEGVQVQEFSCHVPKIIADLREGIVQERYPHEPSTLVFQPQESGVQAYEINDFGRKFLTLSDGILTVKDIAEKLYDSFSESMDFECFLSVCQESASTLANEQCLYLKH